MVACQIEIMKPTEKQVLSFEVGCMYSCKSLDTGLSLTVLMVAIIHKNAVPTKMALVLDAPCSMGPFKAHHLAGLGSFVKIAVETEVTLTQG